MSTKSLFIHCVIPMGLLGIALCVYFATAALKLTEVIEQKNKTIETLERECAK